MIAEKARKLQKPLIACVSRGLLRVKIFRGLYATLGDPLKSFRSCKLAANRRLSLYLPLSRTLVALRWG